MMRKMILAIIFLSLILSSCEQVMIQKIGPAETRDFPAFKEWEIPGTFIPEPINVIGLGDSLTVGVGDEFQKEGYFGRVTKSMSDWQGVLEIHTSNLAKKGRRSEQLLKQLEEPKIQKQIKNANFIYLTIGGNDIMKIVKRDLFKLKVQPFYDELKEFEVKLDKIFSVIRALNGDAVIVVGGLYNPFTIVANEPKELEEIISSWNEAIEVQTVLDPKACFVPVSDLFFSNDNMVYHTDFFHPNAKGYVQMADRYIESIDRCNLFNLSDGELDM